VIYESSSDPLLPRRVFLRRLRRHGLWAFAIFSFSLGIGLIGFHWLCGQPWVDAFLNSAMLLGGMGPVGTFEGSLGKIFAGLYALYAGVVFLGGSALVLAPILHRLLHRWHLERRR
jgi:hypothetical protein